MSKILFIGDPHIRHTHISEGVSLLTWIEQVVEEVKPDLVVNLGDTFNDHSVIRSEVMCSVSNHINKIVSNGTQMVMVLGNHDMWKPNSSQYHALEVFKGRKNLFIADSTIQIDGITFVPYLTEHKNWPTITTKLAVTHNTFIGADFGFKISEEGIPLEKASCDLVVSGHIHKRQTLDNVSYPGTPIAISAGEVDQQKGLMLLDYDTLSTEFIQSPFPMWKSKLISDLNPDKLELDPAHKWVLRLVGPRPEIKSFLESDRVKDLKKSVHFSIKTEFTDTVKSTKTSISAQSVHGMVHQYIDTVYNGQIDRQTIKNTIENYMGKYE